MGMTDILSDYTFQVVLAGTVVLGILCGVMGCFIVLRREALLGDGIAHSAYPGIILAFMILGVKDLEGLLLGAFVSALVALMIILGALRYTRLPFDGLLASVLSGFFGFGIVLVSIVQRAGNSHQAGLKQFIFGQASTILYRDVLFIVCLAIPIILLTITFWKELKIAAFDPEYGQALGFPMNRLHALLGFMVTITVLSALQAVGIILMSAMLVAPAVGARQWTEKLGTMVVTAAVCGGIASAGGTYISSLEGKLPTGPVIVILAVLFVVFSLLFAPKRGLIMQYRHRRGLAKAVEENDVGALLDEDVLPDGRRD